LALLKHFSSECLTPSGIQLSIPTLLFAHGNSSNDVPMILLANTMKDKQDQRLGGSLWVGEYNQIAGNSLARVSVLQQGIIQLAELLKTMGWCAPRLGSSSRN
jgi:hypothetical protein